jgi:hypothetical protein
VQIDNDCNVRKELDLKKGNFVAKSYDANIKETQFIVLLVITQHFLFQPSPPPPPATTSTRANSKRN